MCILMSFIVILMYRRRAVSRFRLDTIFFFLSSKSLRSFVKNIISILSRCHFDDVMNKHYKSGNTNSRRSSFNQTRVEQIFKKEKNTLPLYFILIE